MSDFAIIGTMPIRVSYFLAMQRLDHANFMTSDKVVLAWSLGESVFIRSVFMMDRCYSGAFDFTMESQNGQQRAAVRYPDGKLRKYLPPSEEGAPWVEDL